jgi:DDE family transposase
MEGCQWANDGASKISLSGQEAEPWTASWSGTVRDCHRPDPPSREGSPKVGPPGRSPRKLNENIVPQSKTHTSTMCVIAGLPCIAKTGSALRLVVDLGHYIPLAQQISSQTRRRVLDGVGVPAEEKIVSILKRPSDIIRKDRGDTYYGHKVTLTDGVSGLVLDWVVEEGNPADSTLLIRILERQHDLCGKYPFQAFLDDGYASRENCRHGRGARSTRHRFLEEVRPKGRTQPWLFQQLRNFRAGIEGVISFLKCVYGLSRCTYECSAFLRQLRRCIDRIGQPPHPSSPPDFMR